MEKHKLLAVALGLDGQLFWNQDGCDAYGWPLPRCHLQKPLWHIRLCCSRHELQDTRSSLRRDSKASSMGNEPHLEGQVVKPPTRHKAPSVEEHGSRVRQPFTDFI